MTRHNHNIVDRYSTVTREKRKKWKNKKKTLVVYHLLEKNGWSKVAVNGTHQNREWKFPWDVSMLHFHGHFHRDENKKKGLELLETANGTHIFHSDIPVGNFGLPLKTLRLFQKFSGQSNQNSLFIYIPTEISGFFW